MGIPPLGLGAAVFLDRDGVLNRSQVVDGKPYAPRRLSDFRLLPHTAAGVAALKAAGFHVVVVTNQPDIGNGLVAENIVTAMNDRLMKKLAVDEVLVCPHSQKAGCLCRKPRPGLLLEAAHRRGIDLSRSYMVGDRVSDIVAGQMAGCYTIFVRRGYSEGEPKACDARANSFAHAVRIVLKRTHGVVE